MFCLYAVMFVHVIKINKNYFDIYNLTVADVWLVGYRSIVISRHPVWPSTPKIEAITAFYQRLDLTRPSF